MEEYEGIRLLRVQPPNSSSFLPKCLLLVYPAIQVHQKEGETLSNCFSVRRTWLSQYITIESRYTTRFVVEVERTKYVQEELQGLDGRCVVVDPGRRDMLYCLHERENKKNIDGYERA